MKDETPRTDPRSVALDRSMFAANSPRFLDARLMPRDTQTPATPKRPPAFQFYVDAWFASVSVSTMPPEVEGTYLRLLGYQWLNESLPDDPDLMRRLTKLDAKQWRKAWPLLERHFPQVEGGRRNPTLHALWVERLDFLERQRNNGANGGRPPKPGGKPPKTQKKPTGFATDNPDETSVSGSVTELPLTPDGVTPPSPAPAGSLDRPPGAVPMAAAQSAPVPAPVPDVHQLAELKAAALPHEALALDVLLHRHAANAYAIVYELHAIASGLHEHRGKNTGRRAEAADVMRAISEFAASDLPWSFRHFRGFVRTAADRKPEPLSSDEREAKRLQRQIAERAPAGMQVEQPRTAEELEETRRRVAEARDLFRRMAQGEAERPTGRLHDSVERTTVAA